MIPRDLAQPRPLVQYWHQENIPADVGEMLALAREHNPELRHLVFSEEKAADFIGTHCTSREAEAFAACAVPAMQADYFRYCAIHALGGVYCDADSRCVGSFAPLLHGVGTLFEGSAPGFITNHLFAFRDPGHPLLKLTIDIATAGIESRFSESIVLVTGPRVFWMLAAILRTGSFDAFTERVNAFFDANPRVEDFDQVQLINRERLHLYLESIRSVVGDHSRVVAAFDGVVLLPNAEIASFVGGGGSNLAYKRTEDHFPNWPGSIYR